MSKSLIRKNQLHPDISDLVGEYGSSFFISVNSSGDLINGLSEAISEDFANIVRTTGEQNISGVKNFVTRPTVNGTGVLLSGEEAREFKFSGDLVVTLSNNKTFGKFQNGASIPASGLTTSEVIRLAIVEQINPTVSLTVNPTQILIGQTGISNILTLGRTINNPGATVASTSLEFRRDSSSSFTGLSTDTGIASFTHTFTNASNDSSPFNYRYTVIDSQNSTGTATASATFLHGNYFGYNAATSLTTIAQIEALGNQVLSDSRSRTVSSVTAGAGLYTYYAYRAGAGDLTSIIQDGAAPVLGAFTKQNDIVGTNLNGASVTYRVYISNATQAFTNNSLAFS
jgi:hypothetical protein